MTDDASFPLRGLLAQRQYAKDRSEQALAEALRLRRDAAAAIDRLRDEQVRHAQRLLDHDAAERPHEGRLVDLQADQRYRGCLLAHASRLAEEQQDLEAALAACDVRYRQAARGLEEALAELRLVESRKEHWQRGRREAREKREEDECNDLIASASWGAAD